MRRANAIAETSKKTLSQSVMTKDGKVVWGDPRYGRTLENPEEYIREAEGTVDENGIRRIFIEHTEGHVGSRSRLLQYRRMGYEIKEDEYGHWATIPDEKYQKEIYRPKIERAMKRARLTNPKGEIREGVSGTPLSALNSRDLLNDLPDSD